MMLILNRLHKLVWSIPYIRDLSFKCIRNIWVKLKYVKYRKGATILRFNELSQNTFFVYEGSVKVYVENEKIRPSFLQEIKQGGSFNFVNWALDHSSLFTFKASQNSKLGLLHKDCFKDLSKEIAFNQVIDEIIAVQLFTGSKYDYYVPTKFKLKKKPKSLLNSTKRIPSNVFEKEEDFFKPKDETEELCK